MDNDGQESLIAIILRLRAAFPEHVVNRSRGSIAEDDGFTVTKAQHNASMARK
jgi:hypothetical protein